MLFLAPGSDTLFLLGILPYYLIVSLLAANQREAVIQTGCADFGCFFAFTSNTFLLLRFLTVSLSQIIKSDQEVQTITDGFL